MDGQDFRGIRGTSSPNREEDPMQSNQSLPSAAKVSMFLMRPLISTFRASDSEVCASCQCVGLILHICMKVHDAHHQNQESQQSLSF